MHACLTLSDLPTTMHLYVLKHAHDDEVGSKGSAQIKREECQPMPPLDTISPARVEHRASQWLALKRAVCNKAFRGQLHNLCTCLS